MFWGGQNECSPKLAALCAAIAAIALAIAAAWHPPIAQADGGASARNQTANPTPDHSGATLQDYAQQILRALTDHDTNNWHRYWQARYACDRAVAYARHNDNPPLDRVLLTLTAPICAQLEARLSVNPAAYSPRGENRTVGLLLNEPGAAIGYTLLTGIVSGDVFLLDPLGRVAHAWHMPVPFNHAKLLDNGNLLANMSTISEIDPLGNIAWQYHIGGLHHDFLKMPNGNVMLLLRRYKTRDEVIAAGANPEFVHEDGINYDYLLEVRPTGAFVGKVVWKWSSWDHLVQDFDPTKPNYGAIAERPELIDLNFLLKTISERRPDEPQDWLHANAVDYNPELDQIMLSPRNISELWIIDHSATTQEARGHAGGNSGMGGDLIYRWGTPALTATEPPPTSASSGSTKPTGYRPAFPAPATSCYSTTAGNSPATSDSTRRWMNSSSPPTATATAAPKVRHIPPTGLSGHTPPKRPPISTRRLCPARSASPTATR